MSERVTSSHRLRRILAIVPWVAERDGPTLDEISERFAIDRRDLLADLDVVFMVGIPPYTPDTLIDVVVEDDRVWIRLGDYFRRPLRLSPAEGLALLAAGEAVTAGDDDGPLARGLAKLAGALGVRLGGEGELDVSLGTAPQGTLELLREAVADHRLVELDYYSYGRDEHSTRTVEPARVYAQDGAWYLLGWCHRAEDERVFRLDRIATASLLGDHFTPRDGVAEAAPGFTAEPDDLRVTLRLAPAARWVAEHHPVLSVEATPDGNATVVMAVSELTWLVRLLLRLGEDVEVVAVEGGTTEGGTSVAEIRAQVAATARSILARYRN